MLAALYHQRPGMQDFTPLCPNFVDVTRGNIQGDQPGEELFEVLQAALHHRFVLVLSGARRGSAASFGCLVRIRIWLTCLLCPISLVLEKICEATFRGVTAGWVFHIFKHLLAARYRQRRRQSLQEDRGRQKR